MTSRTTHLLKTGSLSVAAALIAAAAMAGILHCGRPDPADESDYQNARSQPGYYEVLKLRSNPLAGDASYAESEWQMYSRLCSSCHGEFDGQGKWLGYSPHTAMVKAPNLQAENNYKYGSRDLAVFRTIKYGLNESKYHNGSKLSDHEIWILVKFVREVQLLGHP